MSAQIGLVLALCISTLNVAVQGGAQVMDIGSEKQLFIDDRFIESSENVTLTMNPPRKVGPVIETDEEHPWEAGWIGGGSTILEDEGVYKMWYRAHEVGKQGENGTTGLGRGSLCYATSKDGVHWEKPSLGLIERYGSRDNNILDAPIGTVFLDPKAPAEQRFKLLVQLHWDDPERGGMYIYTSGDGLRWKLHATRLFPFCPDTTNHAFYDPRIDRYVIYVRTWDPLRKVGRIETEDIMQPWAYDKGKAPNLKLWGEKHTPPPCDEIPTAISYDDLDPQVSDLYTPAVHQYPWAADAYFAFPSPYLHYPEPPAGEYGNDGLLDIQLAISRTGEVFERPFREPYIALGIDGEPDSRCLYMGIGMIRRGNEVYQFYTGFFHSHGEYVGFTETRGMGKIMRAVQRLDGFVSADADYTGGTLTTPPIRFAGKRLELNINTSAMGEARVEVLDENGKAFEGFAADDCDPIHGNFTAKEVSWQGESDVSALAGKAIKLRFVMRATKLYAFEFVQ